jgi:hypothetical protein
VSVDRKDVLVAVVASAAFGPYVVGGFRTEQIVVYSFAIGLATTAKWIGLRPSRAGKLLLVLGGIQLAVAVAGAFAPPVNTTAYQTGSVLAGVDNLALPVAVLLGALSLGGNRLTQLRAVGTVTVWAMVANAGLEIWAAGGQGPDLGIFHLLGSTETVADRAQQLGRFSGIFNQPAEAGLMYSIALVAAIYLYRKRSLWIAVTGTLLTVGGVLTVSKTFLLVGFPIGIWQILKSSGGRRRRYAALVVVGLAAWAGAKSGLTPVWKGQGFLLELMPGRQQGVIDQYTGGRLGDTSTLSYVMKAVLTTSPVFGFGAGGLLVAYDNAWVEELVMNGVLGVVLYTLTLVTLVFGWVRARADLDAGARRLAGGLVAVVIGASVGIPALTANRCATIVWLLMSLLLARRPGDDRRDQSAQERPGGVVANVGERAGAPDNAVLAGLDENGERGAEDRRP